MRHILFVLIIISVSFLLSSCMLIGFGSPPVSLYWHIQDYGLGDAFFTYDATSNILLIRGTSAYDPHDSAVMAVDFIQRKILWKKVYPAHSVVPLGVQVYDGKVYITEDKILAMDMNVPGLVALDEKTGEIIWKLPFEKSWVNNSFTLYDGYIYTFGGGDYDNTYLYKVNAETGEVVWKVPIESVFGTCPVIDKEYGHVYFGTSVADDGEALRHFYAIDIDTGNVVWKTPIETGGWRDNFLTIPKIYGDSVYGGTMFGRVIRFKRETGEVVWDKRLTDKDGYAFDLGTGGRFWGYKGKIEMTSQDGVLITLNASDGTLAWSKDVSHYVYALHDIYLSDGRIYAHGWGDTIGCFSAEDGRKLWVYTLPNGAQRTVGAPMIIGDYLIDTTCCGDFYVIKLKER